MDMIKSFLHEGLKSYFNRDAKRGINPEHNEKIKRILDKLDVVIKPQDMDLPGFQLHELSGERKGTWEVKVSGNWRITFRFEGEDVIIERYV